MKSLKILTMITITALIMCLIIPMQSIPTRQKRWTFNTWRLHGRRYIPHAPSNPTTESYSPAISTDVNHQDQPLTVDNDDDVNAYNMVVRLLQFFQDLDHESKEYGNNPFSN